MQSLRLTYQNYTSLTIRTASLLLKVCLLYPSVFPDQHSEDTREEHGFITL